MFLGLEREIIIFYLFLSKIKRMVSEKTVFDHFNIFFKFKFRKNGQLGDLTTTERRTPVLVAGYENKNIIKVVGGQFFSMMLNRDGKAFSFGRNNVKKCHDVLF